MSKFLNLITPVNWLHPLNKGLLLRYKCIPGLMSGSRFTNIVNPGALINQSVFINQPTWSHAKGRPGVSFDGVNNYTTVITPSNTIPSGRAARTTSFWMYQRTRTDPVNSSIFTLVTGSGQSWNVQMANVSGVFLFTDGVNGNNNITLTGSQIPELNKWNHVIFCFDGGDTWTYYLNGEFVRTDTFGTAINTEAVTNIEIGRRGVTSGYYDGLLDEVMLHNRALDMSSSGFTAKALFQATRQKYDSTLNWSERNPVSTVPASSGKILYPNLMNGGFVGSNGGLI